MIVDAELKNWATPRQKEIIDAVNEAGSFRGGARLLGLSKNAAFDSIHKLKKRAAREGYAPGHWNSGTAPGYLLGKVTVHRDAGGQVLQTWERQHPELAELMEALKYAIEAAKEEIPRVRAVKAPRHIRDDLCTQYTVTDYHFGMQAHASEGDLRGADWNLEIAEELLVQAIEALAAKSPDSGTAVLGLLGDLLHFDGPDPVTPTHRHPLDSAGRQRTVVRVVVRAIRRVVLHLLTKHGRVVIVVVEGNHDIASTPWLTEVLMAIYANEPRVEILDYDLPYHAFEFGNVMLGFAHGHTKKKESLPMLFASLFRAMWGRVKKVYIHCGHYHHGDEKEHPGAKVIQHPTLAAPDSHALRGGWLSEREMSAIHYHKEFGHIGRDTVTPEMLEAA